MKATVFFRLKNNRALIFASPNMSGRSDTARPTADHVELCRVEYGHPSWRPDDAKVSGLGNWPRGWVN